MKKTLVCSLIAFCRKAKTKVEISSVRNRKIMPRNLNEIVLSWIPLLVKPALFLNYMLHAQFWMVRTWQYRTSSPVVKPMCGLPVSVDQGGGKKQRVEVSYGVLREDHEQQQHPAQH